MKLIFFHKSNNAVGLYRMWTPGKYLAREVGWKVHLFPRWLTLDRVLSGHGKIHNLEVLLGDADLAIYQWFPGGPVLNAMLQLRTRTAAPSLMDLDDDVLNVPAEHMSYEGFKPRTEDECFETRPIPPEAIRVLASRGWQVGMRPDGQTMARRPIGTQFAEDFQDTLSKLNGLTVSTPFLADSYRQHVPERYPVTTLPNCYDPDDWAGVAPAPLRKYPTLVWAGSMAHPGNVRSIFPALRAVFKARPDCKLIVFGANFPTWLELPQEHVEYAGWVNGAAYPRVLASLGGWVGLAPAVDSPFNRAKSHIRWMEYTLAGLPTVASPRPEYLTWADDGAHFADDTACWTDRLLELLGDATLRARLLARAQEVVLACDIRRHLDKWITAYETALREGVKMFELPEHLRRPAAEGVPLPAGDVS